MTLMLLFRVSLYTSEWIEIFKQSVFEPLSMSHSIRVSGLKYKENVLEYLSYHVSLYTSEWIEMNVVKVTVFIFWSHSIRVSGLK